MTDKQAFWKRVEFLCDRPLGAIADSCGIKRSRIYTLRSRGLYPNASECLALSTALGTSIQYLLTGEAPPLPKGLCKEAIEVECSKELQSIIRACLRDRSIVFPLISCIRQREMEKEGLT